MLKRILPALLLVGTSILLSACAAFHNEEIALVENLPDVSQYENKPRVYVDLKFFNGDPNKGQTTEVPQGRDMIQPAIDEMLRSKGIFAEYTFDQFKQKDMDYKLSLHFYNYGNHGGAAVSGFITGFTFGVIPGAATDNYTLKSELTENKNSLSNIESKDSMTTWVGLWFIPMMAYSPQSTLKEVVLNQVKAALEEMIENKQLKYSLLEELLDPQA